MEKIDVIKMVIFLKVIFIFNITLIKISVTFFTELRNVIPKFIWKHKRSNIAKASWNKNSKIGGINLVVYISKYTTVP
jgi:hypothetical protein